MGYFVMKLFLILTKKNLAIISAVIIVAMLLLVQIFLSDAKNIDGSTNTLRTDYLKSIGIHTEDSGVLSKNIIIPESFDSVYSEYNSIQKQSGFDLIPFKGMEATVYTYPLSGDDSKQVHLIVCKGNIIGGDVADISLGGEMRPLILKK